MTYIVEKGDSLYSIANKFNTTVENIKSLNNLKTNTLSIGQVLKIPSNNTYTLYTVKRGDTVYGISNQFGVSAIDISTLNNLNNANISVGQVLKIPIISGDNPDSMFIYTVEKGDSLYNIARRYNTTPEEIIKLNKLSSNTLYQGQKLRIPETNQEVEKLPEYIIYTVNKGDSLYSIAKKYNTTPNKIMMDNNLKSSNLTIGQNLKIRTETTPLVLECFGEEYISSNNNTNIYTVKKGDSLYSIAKKFNTSVENIKNKNNLKSNVLQIGQTLNV